MQRPLLAFGAPASLRSNHPSTPLGGSCSAPGWARARVTRVGAPSARPTPSNGGWTTISAALPHRIQSSTASTSSRARHFSSRPRHAHLSNVDTVDTMAIKHVRYRQSPPNQVRSRQCRDTIRSSRSRYHQHRGGAAAALALAANRMRDEPASHTRLEPDSPRATRSTSPSRCGPAYSRSAHGAS